MTKKTKKIANRVSICVGRLGSMYNYTLIEAISMHGSDGGIVH